MTAGISLLCLTLGGGNPRALSVIHCHRSIWASATTVKPCHPSRDMGKVRFGRWPSWRVPNAFRRRNPSLLDSGSRARSIGLAKSAHIYPTISLNANWMIGSISRFAKLRVVAPQNACLKEWSAISRTVVLIPDNTVSRVASVGMPSAIGPLAVGGATTAVGVWTWHLWIRIGLLQG
ncbi:hypothetical protein F5883DRAFT_82358 [Diaporthe sp. PMI_573]|nr:hypothetical protein F5883DRAFT_82358 [Diaporthaceae sp. PMI_573]